MSRSWSRWELAALIDHTLIDHTLLDPAATLHDVALIRGAVGPNVGVKASGGILYFEDAVAMLEAGATRLGMSHTQQVLDSIPT